MRGEITRVMSAEFVDLKAYPVLDEEHIKEVIYNANGFHVWIHADQPGTKGPMHKHTADQIFFCLEGECTFRFPNGEAKTLTPGMVVTIPRGQLYQLDNTGPKYMILLGSRAEAAGKPRLRQAEAAESKA